MATIGHHSGKVQKVDPRGLIGGCFLRVKGGNGATVRSDVISDD